MRPPLADHPVFGRSLDELEGLRTDTGPFASGDTAWGHRVRRVPLWALDDDDLAFLLSRGRGGPPVLSLALLRMRDDPVRRTAMPPGLLLLVVAATPDELWAATDRAAWEGMRRLIGLALSLAVGAEEQEELLLAAERFSAMLDSVGGTPP